ncbi:MAG: prepilin-type N-terminal cleavage/methylation domain-containing protein [Methylibium sp.]|uniref:prepilin-type N-terminal cleavage/methylation domain-containing protein n=1 Tax=Methylibium sp. TaxID=2067992 RepID=UPI001836CB4E|nr:prepilin-type N-terminal cleavage/methylation domain-containing protein [Methylibium sp.]MBA3597804.1 prepilin-type N-terminal cleavage/methylation domain-containing protein [Methylibium sp.]
MSPRVSPKERGFTLIEAMIALLIIAFGLLALAGMQIMLSRNADVAKQRTEAMRLAQERMEVMRSYTGIASDPAVPLAWQDLDTVSNDPANPIASTYSNTLFSRSWIVEGLPQDALRPVSVTVAWVDRAGEPQSVTLTSVISNTDPVRVGALGVAVPADGNVRQPKNRNINIPVAAIELDEGKKSVYQFKPDLAMVFNNTTGLVVERCNTLVTDAAYSGGTAVCFPFTAVIVSGFVTGAVMPTGIPPAGSLPTLPTGINTSEVVDEDASGGKLISCAYSIAKDQNTGNNLADVHYYLCVIPITTTSGWSGRLLLGGIPTTANHKVCRIQFERSDLLNDNQRNDQLYSNVETSLDNQNYFIDSSPGETCTPPTPPFGGTLVVHQDCRSSAATPADCPASADNTPLQ